MLLNIIIVILLLFEIVSPTPNTQRQKLLLRNILRVTITGSCCRAIKHCDEIDGGFGVTLPRGEKVHQLEGN